MADCNQQVKFSFTNQELPIRNQRGLLLFLLDASIQLFIPEQNFSLKAGICLNSVVVFPSIFLSSSVISQIYDNIREGKGKPRGV